MRELTFDEIEFVAGGGEVAQAIGYVSAIISGGLWVASAVVASTGVGAPVAAGLSVGAATAATVSATAFAYDHWEDQIDAWCYNHAVSYISWYWDLQYC